MTYKAYFKIEKEIKEKHPRLSAEEDPRKFLIDQYTNGEKESLKAMSQKEYLDFLNWLKTTFQVSGSENTDWKKTPENRMRRKIIALLKKQGYKLIDGRADMDRINQWCQKYTSAKKSLNKLTKLELVAAITQVQTMYQKFIEA